MTDWPDRLYCLHPDVRTFSDQVAAPERREYFARDGEVLRRMIAAAILDAQITALERGRVSTPDEIHAAALRRIKGEG